MYPWLHLVKPATESEPEPPLVKPMKIVAIVGRAYVGATPAGGAETMLHDILKFLAKRGHSVTVFLVNVRGKSLTKDGVNVVQTSSQRRAWEGAKDADLIFTQLAGTPLAVGLGRKKNIPVVQVIHNTNEFSEGFLGSGCDFAIYNSEWVSKWHNDARTSPLIKYWLRAGQWNFERRRCTEWPSMVVRPPINSDYYRVDHPSPPQGRITLINPVPNKGPHIFYELARRNPDLGFMVVEGGYQLDKQVYEDLPNVLKHEHVTDVRVVYEKTSVVLMPSYYESYGRVAVEAACSGIPSVVSSTPGLVEALSDAASFVTPVKDGDLSTIDEWQKALDYTLNDYSYCSTTARDRARVLSSSSTSQLIKLEKKLLKLVEGE